MKLLPTDGGFYFVFCIYNHLLERMSSYKTNLLGYVITFRHAWSVVVLYKHNTMLYILWFGCNAPL